MTRVVAILGAGASWDYGFPTGNELLDEVEELCRTAGAKSGRGLGMEASAFLELAQRVYPGKTQLAGAHYLLRQFGELLRGQLPPSIDWFLGQRFAPNLDALPDLGKLAISWLIAKHEGKVDDLHDLPLRQSSVRDPSTGRAIETSVGQHWLKTFWQSLGVRNVEDFDRLLEGEALRLVTFNYDRTLDQFLLNRLKALHLARGNVNGVGEPWIEQLKRLDICHVYGHVGPVDTVPLGATWRFLSPRIADGIDGRAMEQLRASARSLVIVEEERQAIETAQFEKARDWISKADRIVFLGFGFDPTNVERLGFPERAKHFGDLYATTYGIGPVQRAAICSTIVGGWTALDDFGRSHMHIQDAHHDWTVDEYLRHFQPFKDLARSNLK